jgi:hypothetical protein
MDFNNPQRGEPSKGAIGGSGITLLDFDEHHGDGSHHQRPSLSFSRVNQIYVDVVLIVRDFLIVR